MKEDLLATINKKRPIWICAKCETVVASEKEAREHLANEECDEWALLEAEEAKE